MLRIRELKVHRDFGNRLRHSPAYATHINGSPYLFPALFLLFNIYCLFRNFRHPRDFWPNPWNRPLLILHLLNFGSVGFLFGRLLPEGWRRMPRGLVFLALVITLDILGPRPQTTFWSPSSLWLFPDRKARSDGVA
ncbi:hypothetical protein QBC33DRAFT_58317 [Phialemonium atrogriseum]|uniref:Uncharacterized protein n=1 Tax=Phialemonium atrogriseum TaxID=1093897 RepID=A0AAJ0C4Y3_9PEZI|nr:uncharacterized protein QBC33DRAFT_58317 [Phialemonium atrogriseum]KAK1767766.1 hypothetical protein QBC33DRAFT_58317 [Phialemonium atrogriseum]